MLIYVNLIVGAWLIVSPFLFSYRYDTAEFWNSEVIGVMLIIITGVIGFSVPRQNRETPLSQVERRKRA
ncbi:SPW repeat protein [Candidatus Manganitrophus noduliformans]|uniref:SPW repeat protein n=1 Tax=Candidatus Manganitrophus noduliformans TaxID=2606439 RepID=UPI002A4E2360|nr:SPW repeat protein [Candidatus Manganitrophus noduliformans]